TEAALLLAIMIAKVELSRWKVDRKFRTWKTKRATMATVRTAPQMSNVITSIFRWIGKFRSCFMCSTIAEQRCFGVREQPNRADDGVGRHQLAPCENVLKPDHSCPV